MDKYSPTDRLLRLIDRCSLDKKSILQGLMVRGQSISQWRSGKTKPGADTLIAAHKLFGVPVLWLRDGPGIDPPEPGVVGPAEELAARIDALSADDAEAVRHIVARLSIDAYGYNAAAQSAMLGRGKAKKKERA